MLAVAVVSVALTLAIPFKTWLSQRAQIEAAQQANVLAASRITQLQRETRQWHNPTYIERQATRRLHMVAKGKTSYIVTGKSTHKQHHTKISTTSTDQPWYAQLWSPTGT